MSRFTMIDHLKMSVMEVETCHTNGPTSQLAMLVASMLEGST